MALDDRQKDQLLSIHTSAADIERWVLQQVIAERPSRDRLRDIIMQAERIKDLAVRLGGSTNG